MVFSNFLRDILGILIGTALVAVSFFYYPKQTIEKKVLIAPPPYLEYFSFGNQMILADNLWLRAIQDFDYCDDQIAKNRCKNNSWLYQILNSTTNLAPDYYPVYTEGGIALSVILTDVEGASKIYEKGLALYPKDFPLLYRAGLHAYMEEKNKAKAADLYLRAARAQGLEGTWLYSLAARLYTDSGQKEVAVKLYHKMKEEGLEEGYLKRMREKLGIQDE